MKNWSDQHPRDRLWTWKKFRLKLSRRFFNYFVSYLIFLLIIMIVSGSILYNHVHTWIRGNIETTSMTVLSQGMETIEQRIRELEQISQQFPLNSIISPYMLSQGGYETYQLLNRIRMYAVGNSFIYDMAWVYSLDDRVHVVSMSGSYDWKVYLDRVYGFEQAASASILEHVRHSMEPSFMKMEKQKKDDIHRYALYISPLMGNRTESLRFLLFIINESQLNQLLFSALSGYEGHVYIWNGSPDQTDPIFAVSSAHLSGQSADALQLARNYSRSEELIEANDHFILGLHSPKNNLSYVMVMPSSQFLEKTVELRNIFLYLLFGLFFLGIVISLFFARNQYKPWKHLARSAKIDLDSRAMSFVDEMPIISSRIEQLQDQAKTSRELMKEKYLMYLLHGEHDKAREFEAGSDDPVFASANTAFAVVLFRIDRISDFLESNKPAMQQLYKFSLINIAEEWFRRIGPVLTVETPDQGIVMLVNVKTDKWSVTQLRKAAESVQEVYANFYKYTVTIGIGNLYGSMEDIRLSYREAIQAAEFRLFLGGSQTISHEQVESALSRHYHLNPDLQSRLIMSLKQANAEETEAAIRELFHDFSHLNASPESVIREWKLLFNTIVKSLDEMNDRLLEPFRDEVYYLMSFPFEELKSCENRFIRFCLNICDRMRNMRESKNHALLAQLKQYVEQYYADSSLSLESIAEHFGSSPSYLTRFFKDHTGYALIKYVDTLRMSKAKELLRSSEMNIKDIIQAVGYFDEANFRRKFKNIEGITPSQYRNTYFKHSTGSDQS